MATNDKPLLDSMQDIPESLRSEIERAIVGQPVVAVARFDLDAQAMYSEGCLVLLDDRLAVCRRTAAAWVVVWHPRSEITKAQVVEGVGAGMLRLMQGERLLDVCRFTLRHAREAARLQRDLQRLIEGSKPIGKAGPKAEEWGKKKARCDKCGRVIPPWSEVCPACLSQRKVLSRLLDFVKPYRWRAFAGLALALTATAAGLMRPYLSRPMLDVGLGVGPGRTPDYGVLLRYVLLLAGLTITGLIADALRERLMATLGSRISRDIRDRTYAHLHKLSLSFFARKPTGQLVTRVTTDSDRIWDFVTFTVVELTIAVMTLVGVGVALFSMNWRLAFIVLLPVPVMFGLTTFIHKRLHSGFARLFHRWSAMTAMVSDAISGVRVIKAFGKEQREVGRFGRSSGQYYEDEVGMITLWTLFGPLMQFCTQLGTLLVWFVGGYWVCHGRTSPDGTQVWMTPGTLVAFIGYMWMFYGPIHMIAHMDRMFNRAATSVQRIFEILDTEPTVFSKDGARAVDALKGRIEMSHVSFSYDGVRKVLEDVSLDIAPGEMIGLAGPSGGGKTTLVNLVCRFYDALEGEIRIDGIDVREYDVEALRRRIGVVLQEPFLFHGTIAENIAYGCTDTGRDAIIEAARAANAHEFILRFPDGYDTVVGERGQTLSGGELQRISIARALLNNPSILILDEATSSVDTETEKLIQQALVRLTSNRTTIAIAHRLSTLHRANRLVILDKGKLVEQGTHAELLARPDGVYAKLVRVQGEAQSIMGIA